MSRLIRYTQKIFGSTAGATQIAEFGSLAAAAPMTYSGSTITPAIVQGLSEYLEGWFGAIIGNNSPAIEDMNSLCYLFAYQLTYIMQAGLPEWDSATTYYVGDLAQSGGIIYASLTDTNLNNPLTDGSNWLSAPLAGMRTVNAVPFTNGFTLPSGESMMWPFMNLSSGTVSIGSGANLIGVINITVTGSAVLQSTGTGVIRVIT